MGSFEVQQVQADVAVGVFLLVAGITIYLLFGDRTYGTACVGVGLIFIARAMAKVWLFSVD